MNLCFVIIILFPFIIKGKCITQISCFRFAQKFLTGEDFAPQEALGKLTTGGGGHSWEVSSGQKPRMLLNVLQWTGQHPQRIIQSQISVVLQLRNQAQSL